MFLLDVYPHVVLAGMYVLLYLLDCLTRQDAAHLPGVSGSGGRVFAIVSAGRAVIVGGKILYMLPPHVPWLPVHRLAIAGRHPPRSLAIPDRAVVASGALFVIQAGVVVALLASGGDSRSMLAALAVLYGSALLAAVELRHQLPGLSRWRLLECLACPPNALNVLRHHTLRQTPAPLADIIGTSQCVSERMKMVDAVAGLQALLPESDSAALRAALGRAGEGPQC